MGRTSRTETESPGGSASRSADTERGPTASDFRGAGDAQPISVAIAAIRIEPARHTVFSVIRQDHFSECQYSLIPSVMTRLLHEPLDFVNASLPNPHDDSASDCSLTVTIGSKSADLGTRR